MKTNPLKTYRSEAGLTQVQLAAILGVSYATVNHIENGRRRITPERASEWEGKIPVGKDVLCPSVFADTLRTAQSTTPPSTFDGGSGDPRHGEHRAAEKRGGNDRRSTEDKEAA